MLYGRGYGIVMTGYGEALLPISIGDRSVRDAAKLTLGLKKQVDRSSDGWLVPIFLHSFESNHRTVELVPDFP